MLSTLDYILTFGGERLQIMEYYQINTITLLRDQSKYLGSVNVDIMMLYIVYHSFLSLTCINIGISLTSHLQLYPQKTRYYWISIWFIIHVMFYLLLTLTLHQLLAQRHFYRRILLQEAAAARVDTEVSTRKEHRAATGSPSTTVLRLLLGNNLQGKGRNTVNHRLNGVAMCNNNFYYNIGNSVTPSTMVSSQLVVDGVTEEPNSHIPFSLHLSPSGG